MGFEENLEAFLDPSLAWGLCACAEAPKAMPDEEPHVKKAVKKRQQEFRAGRKAARDAMAKLGCPPTTIPVGFRREPIWPSDVMGSISHDAELAIAIVGFAANYRGLGIDIEEDADLDKDLWGVLFTPSELEWLYCLSAKDRPRLARILFSAKESVYKYQFPKTREIPDFTELELRLNTKLCLFDGKFLTNKFHQMVGPIQGRWMHGDGHVLTLAVDPFK